MFYIIQVKCLERLNYSHECHKGEITTQTTALSTTVDMEKTGCHGDIFMYML